MRLARLGVVTESNICHLFRSFRSKPDRYALHATAIGFRFRPNPTVVVIVSIIARSLSSYRAGYYYRDRMRFVIM